MCGLMQRLEARRQRGVPSSDAGNSEYASDVFPMPEQQANSSLDDMAWYRRRTWHTTLARNPIISYGG